MPKTDEGARPAHVASWLGVAGTVVVGAGIGLLVFLTLVGVLIDSDVNATIVLWVCVLLMLGVAAALWRTHNRYWRGLAFGLSGFWLGLILWLMVAALFSSPGMSTEEMDEERASILASGKPAYYLGEEAEGHDLEWVYPNGDAGAEGYQFGYGTKCEGGDSGCNSYIDVSTFSLARGYLNPYYCAPFESVLGVPAVTQDGTLVLFTGSSMIIIHELDTDDDHHGEVALARKLRPLGQTKVVTALPPPTPAVGKIIEQRCGQNP